MRAYSFKREVSVFWLFQKIQTRNWLTSYMNIFLGVFVCLYTMLCWIAFKNGDLFLMISGICVVIIRNAMSGFLKTLNEWKEKGVWGKINLSSVSSITKHAALISFNIFSTFIICIVIFTITIVSFPKEIEYVKGANWSMVWTGILLCWITCYVVALIIHQSFKNYKLANMIGLLIYFSSLQFLGLGFPFETVTSVKWLNYALYAHPFRYTVNIIQAGFVNSPNMIHTYINSSGNSITVDFGYNQIKWLPYLVALAVIGFYSLIYFIRSNTLKNLAQQYIWSNLVSGTKSEEYNS